MCILWFLIKTINVFKDIFCKTKEEAEVRLMTKDCKKNT